MAEKSQKQLKKEQKEAKKEAQRMAAQQEKQKKMLLWTVVIVVVVGALAWLIMSAGGDVTPNTSADPYKGSAEASVVVEEYADYQCPACGAVAPLLEELAEDYGDKIKFVYNDFPLPQHRFADEAAIAAECVGEQDMYFEYHNLLFDNQSDWSVLSSTGDVQDKLIEYAQELGVDMDAFNTCTQSDEIANRVNEDVAEGRAKGVNSTPSLFVNGERMEFDTLGEIPLVLAEAIDAELEAAGEEPGPVAEEVPEEDPTDESAEDSSEDTSSEDTEETE